MNKSESNCQHVYMDTYYLQGYLWGKKDEQKMCRDVIQGIRRSSGHPLIKVKIPFCVVGELINNLNRDNPPNKVHILSNFLELIEKLGADLVPASPEAHLITTKLSRERVYTGDTDILIVSQALADPFSSRLLTPDRVLLTSETIKKIEIDMRKNKKRKQHLQIRAEF